jgi:hypothetical protein
MVGESVGGRQNFFLFGFFLSLPPLTVHWCFLTTEMETLIRHGRRCLSCAGLTLFTLLKHNLTGDGYTGKHICRSIATYSIYIFCLYLDSSSSYSSCINRINSCLDEAAELALLPSFDGCIGEMNVSGNESCYFTQKKKKEEEEEKDEATNQESAFQKHICDFFVFNVFACASSFVKLRNLFHQMLLCSLQMVC